MGCFMFGLPYTEQMQNQDQHLDTSSVVQDEIQNMDLRANPKDV